MQLPFIQLCGGYEQAIVSLMAFQRAAWRTVFLDPDPKYREDIHHKRVGRQRLYDCFCTYLEKVFDLPNAKKQEVFDLIVEELHQRNALPSPGGQEGGTLIAKYKKAYGLHPSVFLPHFLPELFFAENRSVDDIAFAVREDIKTYYVIDFAPIAAQVFSLLAKVVNDPESYIEEFSLKRGRGRGITTIRHFDRYATAIARVLTEEIATITDGLPYVEMFFECCRYVGYLGVGYHRGKPEWHTEEVDAEYLISNLFGFPSGIIGFDELLGGGGIILGETPRMEELGPAYQSVGGRTILLRGRFGTGKSLLATHLAVSVANKGGIAWIVPLELSPSAYLYVIQSMGLGLNAKVQLATGPLQVTGVLHNTEPQHGALIISKTLEKFDDFFMALQKSHSLMQQYSLRLICIDPTNSLHGREDDKLKRRSQLVEATQAVKQSGTNVLLLAEVDEKKVYRGSDDAGGGDFEENIADTVIHLTIKKRQDHAQRYVEIIKSRYQRELRGSQPFVISSGSGVRVSPSSTAVGMRIRPRRSSGPGHSIKFGLKPMDHIIGKDELYSSDVIVLRGPSGTYKTELGLLFLKGVDGRATKKPPGVGESKALVVTVRYEDSDIRDFLRQDYFKQFKPTTAPRIKRNKDYIVCSIPSGNVLPGYIFQQIEKNILAARALGTYIDRVLIDNIAYWELNCPFVREDETFAATLIDLLRRHRLTSFIIVGEFPGKEASMLQQSIIDGADCLIQTKRFEFRDESRVSLRVLKTRHMQHRRDAYEIRMANQELQIMPSTSLLRRTKDGEIHAINVHLYLHHETTMQKIYNEELVSSIKAVLSPHTHIESQDRYRLRRAQSLTPFAAIDELQVLQLDEFQLLSPGRANRKTLPLHQFTASHWSPEWNDFLQVLERRVRNDVDGSFQAVPLYNNIGLLAYRDGLVTKHDLESWEHLEDACIRWENDPQNKNPLHPFFDFIHGRPGNYNCLFFEILYSLETPPDPDKDNQMKEWICGPQGIKAARIYRRLCRKAYLNDREDLTEHVFMERMIWPNQEAVVTRHWYTTLNQVLSGLPLPEDYEADKNPATAQQRANSLVENQETNNSPRIARQNRKDLRVTMLPKGIAVAGEWYVGIPAYSAAPEVGLEIIKELTTHEAELERLRLGVGLPTRSKFYDDLQTGKILDLRVSPYFEPDEDVDLVKVYNSTFRRSYLKNYPQFARALAYHLQRIIMIPGKDGDQQEIEAEIRKVMRSLAGRMDFISSVWNVEAYASKGSS